MTIWNFSAGPSKLPTEVLQQAASEMLDWQGSGVSVMEMSHRSTEFNKICDEAEADLRTLLDIPNDYAVLFMQGGATVQNALVPLNVLPTRSQRAADYAILGSWSKKSHKEALNYGQIAIASTNAHEKNIDGVHYAPYCWVADFSEWEINPDASYLHICTNETIGGLALFDLPDMQAAGAPHVPLVLDKSSDILSHPFDVNRAGLIYAGAQKNAGPAGVTLVIVKRDLLGKAMSHCPSALDFANVAAERSRFNTPPTYGIYICGLVFKWLLNKGGLAAIEHLNKVKAEKLYKAIDATDFYRNNIQHQYRSRMNVPFLLADETLNTAFLEGAKQIGLLGLKGHKSVGGMRASIYNAMPIEGVDALIEYLHVFERSHG